ncbi:MAG: hypothetical protein AAGH92_09025, partial [Planctomycetota bacterium]
MQRLKVKDRFEFPMQINLEPYTVEGLGAKDGTCINSKGKDEYEYELVGVIVHSGSAFAGHYYSYIKERSGSKGSRSSGRDKNHTPQWFLFDDNRVEPYNIENLEADCFGGKYTMEVYDSYLKENTIQEHERHYSAYMLLYENCSQAVENVSVSQVADDLNDAEPETAEGDADEDKIVGILKSLVTEMPKGRGKTKAMPLSVLHSIVEQNLKFGHESKLLSAEYDEFFLNLLINVASKWCNGPHNLHATNTPSKDKDTCDLSEEGDESRNPESYWREYAIFSVRLAGAKTCGWPWPECIPAHGGQALVL